jgi:uncharacterized protein (TIGR00251 family)
VATGPRPSDKLPNVQELKLTCHADHVLIDVHVVPRASRTKVVGLHDGRLKVALEAPPVDGAANEALIAFLAKSLGLPKKSVQLVRGDTSRQKTLAIYGASEADVRALVP